LSYDPLRLSPCSEDLYTRVKHIHMSLTNVTLLPPQTKHTHKRNTHTREHHTQTSVRSSNAHNTNAHNTKPDFTLVSIFNPAVNAGALVSVLVLVPHFCLCSFLFLLFSCALYLAPFALLLYLAVRTQQSPLYLYFFVLARFVVAAWMPLCACQLQDPPLYLRLCCCRLHALVCLPTTRPAFALARLLLPLVVAACMPLCVCQLPDPPLYLRVFALLPLYLRVL